MAARNVQLRSDTNTNWPILVNCFVLSSLTDEGLCETNFEKKADQISNNQLEIILKKKDDRIEELEVKSRRLENKISTILLMLNQLESVGEPSVPISTVREWLGNRGNVDLTTVDELSSFDRKFINCFIILSCEVIV